MQKHYPPNFDPSKLKKVRQQHPKPIRKINMMLPITFRCTKCGEYLGAGTKVNSRKEKAIGFEYLNIPSFRFYQQCRTCHSEFTFRTDPQHSCYVPESGVTAAYNPQRERALEAQEKAPVSSNSAMERLEARVLEARNELQKEERLADLLEIANAREAATVKMQRTKKRHLQEEEDDAKEVLDAFASRFRRLAE
jgi:hypothetical protein